MSFKYMITKLYWATDNWYYFLYVDLEKKNVCICFFIFY